MVHSNPIEARSYSFVKGERSYNTGKRNLHLKSENPKAGKLSVHIQSPIKDIMAAPQYNPEKAEMQVKLSEFSLENCGFIVKP
mmetsp:Transcript_7948/g.12049  ORF Transcript_7948/g.12049 Transcript_7948/m.12049 type:complete len:83 (+) Transcript_7948:16-264(+)